MTDDLRWAARYAFCEELWRDRARVVWDRQLESALTSGRLGDATAARGGADEDVEDPIVAMLDGLLPRRAADGERSAGRIDVSMGVQQEAAGRKLAPRRPATQFLTLGPLCDAIGRRDWSVALVDLSDLLVSDGPGESSRLSVRGAELIEALASRLHDTGRTAVVSVVAEGPAWAEVTARGGQDRLAFGVDYEGLREMLAPLSEGGAAVRVYGLLVPSMAAIVELGDDEAIEVDERTAEVLPRGPAADGTFRVTRLAGPADSGVDTGDDESEDERRTAEVRGSSAGARRGSGAWREGKPRAARWSAGGDLEVTSGDDSTESGDADDAQGHDDDVPLSYDNTLGSQEPVLHEYIAIVGHGAADFVAEGMTLIELPLRANPPDAAPVVSPVAPLRAQLAESRRQADLAAIERNTLVERLDVSESANAALSAEAGELRDRLARALAEAPEPMSAEASERLDVARAELQGLRWQLTQAQRALDEARSRPVEALEAEVARLTADAAARSQEDARSQEEDARSQEEDARSQEEDARSQEEEAGASEPPPTDDNGPSIGVSSSPTGLSGPGRSADAHGRKAPQPPAARPPRAQAKALLHALDGLLHRVERSDISALELRTRLVALRARLRG